MSPVITQTTFVRPADATSPRPWQPRVGLDSPPAARDEVHGQVTDTAYATDIFYVRHIPGMSGYSRSPTPSARYRPVPLIASD